MRKKIKRDLLSKKLVDIFHSLPTGSVLDLGCGEGNLSHRIKAMNFEVVATDSDSDRFRYHGIIPFHPFNLDKPLPFCYAFGRAIFSASFECSKACVVAVGAVLFSSIAVTHACLATSATE